MRIDQLMAEVGEGRLTGKVEFDQAYAHRQHEDLAFKHPHGGGPKFLEAALYESIPENMTLIANSVLRDNVRSGVILATENVATRASAKAPRRDRGESALRRSDHPTVTDGHEVIYSRPPRVHHLTPEEIEDRNMELQDSPRHYYGTWPQPGST